VNFLVLGHFLV